jgi:hypothetical protein
LGKSSPTIVYRSKLAIRAAVEASVGSGLTSFRIAPKLTYTASHGE